MEKIRLFFASIQMMAINDYDISPYEQKLEEFEREEEVEKNGQIPKYITMNGLANYIDEINYYEYGFEIKNSNKESKLSYMLTNYRTGKIKYVCFYESDEGDISTTDIQYITDRCIEIWNGINEESNDGGFFGPNSNYECLIVVNSKIGSYPRERIANIKQFSIIDEKVILVKPFNTPFQSEIKVMTNSEYNKNFGNIPKANMPSIGSSDVFMKYREISNAPVKIYRNTINSIQLQTDEIHYKLVNK